MEIERKFILNKPDFDLSAFKKTHIDQYYISTDPTIRIRQTDDEFILTVKGKGELAREEFELALTEKQYTSLKCKTDLPPVSKTRYFIPIENNLTAELDVYENALDGLFTVEVEFNSIEQAKGFVPPSWFGKDVTTDNRYKNTSLYTKGMPK